MRVSAKADYAVRAAVELATQPPDTPVKADQLAASQETPLQFHKNVRHELRQHDVVDHSRGTDGGYYLARPAAMIKVGEVVRAVDGPLAAVHGQEPEELAYQGSMKPLQDVWL